MFAKSFSFSFKTESKVYFNSQAFRRYLFTCKYTHCIHANQCFFSEFINCVSSVQTSFKMFPSPQEVPHVHLETILSPVPSPRQALTAFCSRDTLVLKILHKSKNTIGGLFWMLLLLIMFLTFTCVEICWFMPFYGSTVPSCIDRHFFYQFTS